MVLLFDLAGIVVASPTSIDATTFRPHMISSFDGTRWPEEKDDDDVDNVE